MIDWPNLLIGALLGLLVGAPFYYEARKDAERQYQKLVGMLEALQQQGTLKIAKDQKGLVLSVEAGNITLMGMPATLRATLEKGDSQR